MYVQASGSARFKVKKTGKVVTVAASDLDWDCEGDGERSMGPELIHSTEADVDGHTVRWSLWEYPLGVENTSETDVPPALALVQDITYSLAHEPENE